VNRIRTLGGAEKKRIEAGGTKMFARILIAVVSSFLCGVLVGMVLLTILDVKL